MKLKCLVLIDGQNLFEAARSEFGAQWPNFDAGKLAQLLALKTGSVLCQTRFYCSVPAASVDGWWHAYWANKCSHMERNNVITVTRSAPAPAQGLHARTAEKAICLRIGLDMVRAAHEGGVKWLIVVSNDTNLVEAVREARLVARKANRCLRIASAHPDHSHRFQGIYQTVWLPICASEYAQCMDARDYRPSDRQLKALTQVSSAPRRGLQHRVP